MTGDTTVTLKERYSEFQSWRAERPFAGSVLLVLAGMVIGYVPLQMVGDITFTQGSFVFIGLIFGLLVSLSGVLVLMRPEHSTFFGIAGVLLSTFSIVGALGGLFVGTVLGTIGGVLCFAWRPADDRDTETAHTARLAGFRAFLRRNSEVMLLLGLTGILLLYFLHPLFPAITLPGAEAQTTWSVCDPTGFPVDINMNCQNPPNSADYNAGLGGVSVSFGSLTAGSPGLSENAVTNDTSETTGITMARTTIQNSTIEGGFIARKNFADPTGSGAYHLELTASSSFIGGSSGSYILEISELYGERIEGTILGITIGDDEILVCEPRNYDTINLADDSGSESLNLYGVTLNAHYINAQNWRLQDFDLSMERSPDPNDATTNPQTGTSTAETLQSGAQVYPRTVATDNGDQIGVLLLGGYGGNSDTCPGTH